MTQKIRVHLVNGMNIDCVIPDGINFGGLCASIRETGGWLDESFMIPADKIVAMIKLGDDNQSVTPVMKGTIQ